MPLKLEFASKYEASIPIDDFEDIGLDRVIYTGIDKLLSPPLIEAVENAEKVAKPAAEKALTEARLGWEKLSYAIGKGVVEHIKANMEIHGIQTSGNIDTTVSGETDQALNSPYDHGHGLINSSGEEVNVEFTQSNDGKGLVR